jgi:hypothetical protein
VPLAPPPPAAPVRQPVKAPLDLVSVDARITALEERCKKMFIHLGADISKF